MRKRNGRGGKRRKSDSFKENFALMTHSLQAWLSKTTHLGKERGRQGGQCMGFSTARAK